MRYTLRNSLEFEDVEVLGVECIKASYRGVTYKVINVSDLLDAITFDHLRHTASFGHRIDLFDLRRKGIVAIDGALYTFERANTSNSSEFDIKKFDLVTGEFIDVSESEFDMDDWTRRFSSINQMEARIEDTYRQMCTILYDLLTYKMPHCKCCGRVITDTEHCHAVAEPAHDSHGREITNICNDCYDNLPTCDVCGHRVTSTVYRIRTDQDTHVRECYACTTERENATGQTLWYCDECGDYTTRDNYDPDMDCCIWCSDRVTASRLIKRWNYKPDPLFTDGFDCKHVCNPTPGMRYVGLEIEVDCGERLEFVGGCYKAARELGYNDLFYFMHDGSLHDANGVVTGVEVTTVPIALPFVLDGYPFEFIHEQAKKYHMKSHNTSTCGLHVHVNKDSIPDFDATMAKVLLAFDKFYVKLCHFGRRISKEQARRWADRPRANITKMDDDELLRAKLNDAGYSHYKAVNLSPASTVEFRLWKGTHNPDTLRATVDFVSAMLDTCYELNLESLYDMDWDGFIHAILPHIQLSKTLDYITHRGLLN